MSSQPGPDGPSFESDPMLDEIHAIAGDLRGTVPGMTDFLKEIAEREAAEAADRVETGPDQDAAYHDRLRQNMW